MPVLYDYIWLRVRENTEAAKLPERTLLDLLGNIMLPLED